MFHPGNQVTPLHVVAPNGSNGLGAVPGDKLIVLSVVPSNDWVLCQVQGTQHQGYLPTSSLRK